MIAFLCLPALAARCDQAPPLTPAVASGEWTEELLTPGTTYYVEPSNCLRGQVLVATVTCDEGDTRGPGGICFFGGACLTCCTAQATLSDPPALCAPARVPHTPTPLILCFFMCSARRRDGAEHVGACPGPSPGRRPSACPCTRPHASTLEGAPCRPQGSLPQPLPHPPTPNPRHLSLCTFPPTRHLHLLSLN